jgi:hypothetical protein
MSSLKEDIGPDDERWWDQGRTAAFVSSLSPIQAQRLEALRKGREFEYRAAYRRTRSGKPVWEVRRDDIFGCLQTARGGSSKQALVQAGGGASGHEKMRVCGQLALGLRPSEFQSCGHLRSGWLSCSLSAHGVS